ncbi:MAG: hypothetical protein JNL60_10380 [Bacteroidia bacterium]|nr:hypothetical protein [Bacteroidia bacterium]
MKKNIIFLAFILTCFLDKAGNGPALRDAKIDFKRTNEAYAKLEGISMDTYYIVYDDHQSKSALEGKNGSFIKYRENTYTMIDGIEMLSIGKMLISVNPDIKLITIGDNKPLELSPLQTNLDTILALCDDIKVEQAGMNEKKYKLYFKDELAEYSEMDVHIDTKNLRYVKIVLFYNTKMNLRKDFYAEEKTPRLEIIYKNFKLVNQQPEILNPDLYVLNIDGKLKPTGKYYNYKVSDQRKQSIVKTKK